MFTVEPKSDLPIPKPVRKGEESEYVTELMKLKIGEYTEFATDGEHAKKIKYTINKLQKDGKAQFSLRTGKNGEPSRVWRIELKPKVAKAAKAEPDGSKAE